MFYDFCLDDLFCLSIDKLFIVSRNDIIRSFYTNYHCFICISDHIMPVLQYKTMDIYSYITYWFVCQNIDRILPIYDILPIFILIREYVTGEC